MNLLKLNLTDDEVKDIALLTIQKANKDGFVGFAGYCGQAAIAINDVLFNGEQTLFAAFNKALEEEGHNIGHIACLVETGDDEYFILDSDAYLKGIDDITSWGMLAADDSYYQELFDEHDIEKTELNFETVSELELDVDFIKENFNCSKLEEQTEILKKAYLEVLSNLKISQNQIQKNKPK